MSRPACPTNLGRTKETTMSKTNKKPTFTMIGVLALALGGCATHSIAYKTGLNGGGKVQNERESYFLWGLAGGKTLKLDEICPAVWRASRTDTRSATRSSPRSPRASTRP